MHVHFLQHVPFEKPAVFSDWVEKKHYPASRTLLYNNEKCPHQHTFEILVIMGGPMSIYDEKEYPWLKQEKEFIRKSIERRKLVLGVCLGAQLIADALGANVFKNEFEEIGWFPINLTSDGRKHRFFTDFPVTSPVFHWHGNTFEIPENAIHTLENPACRNQAFVYEDHVVALQFHMEIKQENISEMLFFAGNDITPSRYVQSADIISANATERTKPLNKYMLTFLDRFVAQNSKSI